MSSACVLAFNDVNPTHASQHASGSVIELYTTPPWHLLTSYSACAESEHISTWLGTSMPTSGSRPIGVNESTEVTLVKLNRPAHDPALARDAPSAPPAAWRQ